MRILLLRHGQAAAGGIPDALRHLTARGRQQALAAGEWLAAEGLAPGRVWCSPFVRTVQTAELAAQGWGVSEPVEARAWLAGGALGELLDAVAAEIDELPVLLVGHLPDLGHLARLLTGLPRLPDPSPGTLIALEGEPIPGRCSLTGRCEG